MEGLTMSRAFASSNFINKRFESNKEERFKRAGKIDLLSAEYYIEKHFDTFFKINLEAFKRSLIQSFVAMCDEQRPQHVAAKVQDGREFPNVEAYPEALTAKMIQKLLGVSIAKAYQLMKHHKCPHNPLLGKNKVPKTEFLEWVKSQYTTFGLLGDDE